VREGRYCLGGEMQNKNESRQIDKKTTKQVRIDADLHRLLKIKAATEKTSIKVLLEEAIADILEVKEANI